MSGTGGDEWRGRVGESWAREWRRTDRSLAELSRTLDAAIAAAAPAGPFRALDVGCGAGMTSAALYAARPDATIVGVDLSAPLLAIARERLPQASFFEGDANRRAAEHGPFELICSRHGVMFFDDPVAAFRSLRAAATGDAALVFSCFRDWRENAFYRDLAEALDLSPPDPAAPGPFAFADEAHVRAILADAGWRDVAAHPADFAYRAGQDVDDAADFLSQIGPAARALRDAPADQREIMRDRMRAVLAVHAVEDGSVDFPAAAWIWTARAR